MTSRLVLIFLIVVAFSACTTTRTASVVSKDNKKCDNGEIVRAAFDIGSSGPSVRVACVAKTSAKHFNRYKTVSVFKLATDSEDIDFSKVLLNWRPPANCSSAVLDKFKALIEIVEEYKPAETRAAATAAFRKSPRGSDFIDKLNECFMKINARIVSQRFEGELEYRAVADKRGLLAINTRSLPLVWGIGSTSVQLTFPDNSVPLGEQKFLVYDGKAGASIFFDSINKERKSPQLSTYPISDTERNDYLVNKREFVENTIPAYLLAQIASSKVVGVGNSHNYLFVPRTKSGSTEVYSPSAVKVSLDSLIGKDETKIERAMLNVDSNARYHDHTVSTLVLVEGFLAGLGVDAVEIVETDVADGVLVYQNW